MPKVGRRGEIQGSLLPREGGGCPGGKLQASPVPARVRAAGKEAVAIWRAILGEAQWGSIAGEADRRTLERYCEICVERDKVAAAIREGGSYGELRPAQQQTERRFLESMMHKIEMEYERRVILYSGQSRRRGPKPRSADVPAGRGARAPLDREAGSGGQGHGEGGGDTVPWAGGRVQ